MIFGGGGGGVVGNQSSLTEYKKGPQKIGSYKYYSSLAGNQVNLVVTQFKSSSLPLPLCKRPSSNVYFALRIQQKITNDFWYRVGRGRSSTRFLLAFVNSVTFVEKGWIICRKISRFLQISLRDSHAASVKSDSFLSPKNRCKEQLVLIQLRSAVRKETES